jgi:hypothetical protein
MLHQANKKILSLLVPFCTLFFLSGCSNPFVSNKNNNETTVSSSVKTAVGKPSYKEKIIEENSTKDYYNIEIKYPEFYNLKNSSTVNSKIKNLLENKKKSFIKEVLDWNNDSGWKKNLPIDESNSSSYMEVDYKVYNASENFISVDFDAQMYMSSSAHPYFAHLVVNLNPETLADYSVDDIFNAKSDYAKALESLTKSNLKERGLVVFEDSNFSKDLFKKFVVSKDSYFIVFDDSEITAHAAGNVTIEIPWSKISKFLNPNFKISNL